METPLSVNSKSTSTEVSISDEEIEGSNDSSSLLNTNNQCKVNIDQLNEFPNTTVKVYRRESISGPTKGSAAFTIFITTLTLMIISGSSNDFLGKLIYQLYPCNKCDLEGVSALKHEYWLTFLLTFGSFFVCTFALFSKSSRKSFDKVNRKVILKMIIPSVMDTLVTGGRYLGMLFLSAALISILKNGSQLLFLALLRHCFHHKKLLCAEWFGIGIIIMGLFIVTMNRIYESISESDNGEEITLKDSTIGIIIMISVGFAGAIRNDIEELLLKNDNLDSNFVVGLESAISLIFTAICGIILFMIDPFDNIDKNNMFKHIYRDIITQPAFMICFALFLVAIYTKDTMQMKMTVLSSSLTRKLFQQMYPSGTWIISLIAFEITGVYGESWKGKYSWIRLAGFVVVFIGNYIYIKGYVIFRQLSACKKNITIH